MQNHQVNIFNDKHATVIRLTCINSSETKASTIIFRLKQVCTTSSTPAACGFDSQDCGIHVTHVFGLARHVIKTYTQNSS